MVKEYTSKEEELSTTQRLTRRDTIRRNHVIDEMALILIENRMHTAAELLLAQKRTLR